ncbi:hypothetical protein BGZ60DRAFT_493635, partial [Tricladium varicosporioides]
LSRGPSSALIIGSQTLLPGSAITVDGQEISLAPSGGAVVINGAHQTPSPSPYTNLPAVISIGGSRITADSSSGFLIGGAPTPTITNGVKNSGPTTFATSTVLAVTQASISSVVIAGQTLTVGGRATVGGEVLSIGPSGIIVVIGTVSVGGGQATATAIPSKKKSAGSDIKPNSWVSVCFVLLSALYLFA